MRTRRLALPFRNLRAGTHQDVLVATMDEQAQLDFSEFQCVVWRVMQMMVVKVCALLETTCKVDHVFKLHLRAAAGSGCCLLGSSLKILLVNSPSPQAQTQLTSTDNDDADDG